MMEAASMNDEELHASLVKHGITTPVTATTRPLLVKKLIQVMQKGHNASVSSNRRMTRRSLQSMSSDEDDEDVSDGSFIQSKAISKRKSNKEMVITPSRTSTPSQVISPRARGANDVKHNNSTSKLFPGVSPRNPTWRKMKYDYDSLSDTDDQGEGTSYSFSSKRSGRSNIHQKYMLNGGSDSLYDTEKISSARFRNFEYSTLDQSNNSNGSLDGVSNFSPSSSIVKRNSIMNPLKWLRNKFSFKSRPQNSSFSRSVSNPTFVPWYSRAKTALSEAATHGIPALLLLLLLSFFVIIGFSYLNTMQTQQLQAVETNPAAEWENVAGKLMQDDELKLPICSTVSSKDSNQLCLTVEELSVVHRVLREGRRIVLEAETRSAEYQCGLHHFNYLTTAELNDKLALLVQLSANEKPLAVSSFIKLCALNPSLQLEPVYKLTPDGMQHDVEHPLGLRLKNPKIQLMCTVMYAASLGLYFLVLIALGSGVFYTVLMMVRRRQHNTELHKQEVFRLVSEVLSIVQSSDEGYCAILHVRDQIFSPQERIKKIKLWQEVINFIENHESRVTSEVKIVGGEECETWRWIGQKKKRVVKDDEPEVRKHNVTPSIYPKLPVDDSEEQPEIEDEVEKQQPSDTNDDDEDDSMSGWWQGSGVKRSVVQPPTRCLKIRNLPTDTQSPDSVQRALLRKCKGLPVLHLAVDRLNPEGVVYLMTDSTTTAGKIHTLLHGRWFAGQLLSVKFLRDQRYFERFPSSQDCITPLKA